MMGQREDEKQSAMMELKDRLDVNITTMKQV